MNDKASVKLASINIEGHKHFHERILPFLQQFKPDVVCLQEVFSVDVPFLKEILGMDGLFMPTSIVTEVSVHQPIAMGEWGVLLLSSLPISQIQGEYYVGTAERIPPFMEHGNPNGMNRVFIWATVMVGQTPFTIGTTHFTWSVKGEPTEEQDRDLHQLFSILDSIPDVVFCGDFNAPRGKATFAKIAERYTDHIPPSVTTSIDPELHKAGALELMVDALFSTPEYTVTDVKVSAGVSDHQAITATVSRDCA
ncbi:MAG: endonuclease/exonuclease/phosphatase family protein [bacterium]|nr:endonuclease/exonuclease/phosphatase family protein [bacterium]